MFDLQDSLDERLRALKKKELLERAVGRIRQKRDSHKPRGQLNYVSREEIKESLTRAGIVNKKGEMTEIRVS